jgi:hypothetical protein
MRKPNMLLILIFSMFAIPHAVAYELAACPEYFQKLEDDRNPYGKTKVKPSVPPDTRMFGVESFVAEKIGDYFKHHSEMPLMVQFANQEKLEAGLSLLFDIGIIPTERFDDELLVSFSVDLRGLHNALYTLDRRQYFLRSEFEEKSGTFYFDLN